MAVPVDRLCSKIEAFYRTYHETVGQYPQPVLEKLPSFIRGPHRSQVFVCKDGVGVISYPSPTAEIACSLLPDQGLETTMNARTGLMQWHLTGKGFVAHAAAPKLTHYVPGKPLSVYAPTWDLASVFGDTDPGRWTAEAAATEAHQDVAAWLVTALMELPAAAVKDGEASKRLQEVLVAFEALLDTEPHEEAVQQFLTANRVLIDPTALSATPKVKLGTEYVTDFVVQRSEGDYELVEIEPPGERLFTGKGDPTSRLSHAQKQVEDWREWVAENISYARTTMPGITEPRGRVVMGRRSHLTSETERALRRRNQELHHLSVETFDDLIRRVRQTIQNIG